MNDNIKMEEIIV
jgi:hypothetical protein